MEKRPPTLAQWQCIPIIVLHLLTVAWAVMCVVHDFNSANQWYWNTSITGVTLAFSALIAKDRLMFSAGLSTVALCVVLFVMDHKLQLGETFRRSWSWAVLFPYELVLLVASLTKIRALAPLPPDAKRFQFSIRFLLVQTVALSLAFATYRLLYGLLLGFSGHPPVGSPMWDDLDWGYRLRWRDTFAIAMFVYVSVCTIDAIYCALCDGMKACQRAKPRDRQEASLQN